MKNRYIELMEKTLSAYTYDHILRYFNDVKENGLKEHGFPRLTSNIGILIAKGRRRDLLPIFLEMMELCCKTIPTVKAANDFSVREIACCILELEKTDVVNKSDIERWKSYFSEIEPKKCYNVFVNAIGDYANNWALFSGVSEYFRRLIVPCNNMDFIELQAEHNLLQFDENGMYKDDVLDDVHQAVMYDIVPRALFVLLLDAGYSGRLHDEIDANLKKSGLCTLKMQSPNGEAPFGGRSNQFIHNESVLSVIYEYEAKRYKNEGNIDLAKKFKSAIDRALSVIDLWLSKKPIHHIKNRFPTETEYGCENYAYFDKYMISVASFLYAAYLVCDDSIPTEKERDTESCAWNTSYHFHKLFLKAGGYGLEFDLNADQTYDSNGLGRIHREGAPSPISLSCPCPAPNANYKVDIEAPFSFSACSAIKKDGDWLLGAADGSKYEIYSMSEGAGSASADLLCRFDPKNTLKESYTVSKNGVSVTVEGKGELGFALPAFCFDGECYTEILHSKNSLAINYDGWTCRYTTDGEILDLEKTAANRNGHYHAFLAVANKKLNVKIEIVKQ